VTQITKKVYFAGPFGALLLTTMSIQPTDDLLTVLRANLRRVQEIPQDGLTPAALELKVLLLRRIAIIETAMEKLATIIANRDVTGKG
jgi:hypothetical protein